MTKKDSKMDAGTKLRLASIPRTRCSKCNKVKTYLSPTEKCFKCGKPFCLDHFWYEWIKLETDKVSKLRNVCDECKEKYIGISTETNTINNPHLWRKQKL